MFYKIFIGILLINTGLLSQNAVLFKTPPGNLTLPSVIQEENGAPKSSGMGIIESKWVSSSSTDAEALLQNFSTSTDVGLRKIIKDILTNANIPEGKLSQLSISFTSAGIEERAIVKDSVTFSDDFAAKYPAENMFMITKLYRTKNAVVELTISGVEDFDPAIKDAISEGLRFGNKTETVTGNKMVIEIQHLIFAYEYVPMNITRIVDKSLVLPLYMTTDIGLNSIGSMSIGEGAQQYDYGVKVSSDVGAKPSEFRISNVNPKASFRVGKREGYTLNYLESGGNKVTFSISGFVVSFP